MEISEKDLVGGRNDMCKGAEKATSPLYLETERTSMSGEAQGKV